MRGSAVTVILLALMLASLAVISASAEQTQGAQRVDIVNPSNEVSGDPPRVTGAPLAPSYQTERARTQGIFYYYSPPIDTTTIGYAPYGQWVWDPTLAIWRWVVIVSPPVYYYSYYPYYPYAPSYQWWRIEGLPPGEYTYVPNPDFEKGPWGMLLTPKSPQMGFAPGEGSVWPWKREKPAQEQPEQSLESKHSRRVQHSRKSGESSDSDQATQSK